MLWGRLADWLQDTAEADIGAGGLFNTTTPLIRGWFLDGENENASFPYVTTALVSEVENDVLDAGPRAVEIEFQFGVYTDAIAGQQAHEAITDRIYTLFRRVAPSVSGFTCSQILILGVAFTQITDRARYTVIRARTLFAT